MCKLIIQILLFLLLAAATGCDRDDMLEERDSVPLTIEPVIESLAPEVRTTMTGDKETFASGDVIGVFENLTGTNNARCVYNGTKWTFDNPIYWQNGTSTHVFYGYYPYKTTYGSGLNVSIPVLANQTVSSVPDASANLLVSGPYNQSRSSGVDLPFRHAFALIQLNIKMGVSLYALNGITIKGGNPTASSNPYGIFNTVGNSTQVWFNFASNAVQADVNTVARFSQSTTFNVPGIPIIPSASTFYIFILPGTYTAPVPSVAFTMTLLGVGLISSSSTAEFGTTTFVAGSKYRYDVTINRVFSSPKFHTAINLREVTSCDNINHIDITL